MRFANAARTEQQRDAVLVDELQRREFADRCLIDRGIKTKIKGLERDRLRESRLLEAKLQRVLFPSIKFARQDIREPIEVHRFLMLYQHVLDLARGSR